MEILLKSPFNQVQYDKAVEFLAQQMGQMVNRASREKMSITLSKDEMQVYIKRFQMIDKDHKGYVSINDIRRSMKVRSCFDKILLRFKKWWWQIFLLFPSLIWNFLSFSQSFGEDVSGEELHDILREIDTNMNGQVELDEYLQVSKISALW